MRSVRHAPAVLAITLAGVLPALADPVDDPGRLLASNCFQCHGPDGQGTRGGFDGIEAGEVVSELREMARSSNYGGEEGIMRVHAAAYTTAEIRLIADYLSRACGTGCTRGDSAAATDPVPAAAGTGATASVGVVLRVPNAAQGDVHSDNPALECTARCTEVSAELPSGSAVVLSAVPRDGRRFAGWTGGCQGADPVCVLNLDTGTRVSAWFYPN